MYPGVSYVLPRRNRFRQRVYMENGTVSHMLDYESSPDSNDPSMCGRAPWPTVWRGASTQEERDRAAELRLCVRCEAILRHQAGGVL